MDPDLKKRLVIGFVALALAVVAWNFLFSGSNAEGKLESGTTEQRLAAIAELEQLNSANAAELISKYANDPDTTVARRVIVSMGRMKDQVPTEMLLPLLDSEKVELREAAVVALGSRGRDGNPARLREQMLKDPEASVRAAAVAELKGMRDWDSMASFAKLLSSDPDVMVQNCAADAMAHIGGVGHEGLRPDASPQQRQQAFRFLQQFWPSFKHQADEYQTYLQVKGKNQ